jgi:hypothetical protein
MSGRWRALAPWSFLQRRRPLSCFTFYVRVADTRLTTCLLLPAHTQAGTLVQKPTTGNAHTPFKLENSPAATAHKPKLSSRRLACSCTRKFAPPKSKVSSTAAAFFCVLCCVLSGGDVAASVPASSQQPLGGCPAAHQPPWQPVQSCTGSHAARMARASRLQRCFVLPAPVVWTGAASPCLWLCASSQLPCGPLGHASASSACASC